MNYKTPVVSSTLKIVTINISETYLDMIEVMVKLGFQPSRSEAIRQALNAFLHAEKKMYLGFKKYEQMKKEQFVAMMEGEYN